MSDQNQFLKDALSSEYGFVELEGKQIGRKFFRNALYCLTYPDIEEGIQWLMESLNRDYNGSRSIIQTYKRLDNRDFDSNMTNEFLLNKKIKLICLVAEKMEQIFVMNLQEERNKLGR